MSAEEKDIIFDLVQHLLRTRYEDLHAMDIEATKMHILDTLGVSIAGAGCFLSGGRGST
ncbi:MAG: hypothetical protein MIO92_03525 [Methanosarcinaceae archaeon]|nr:hypothetical protein [Methanosarcinaceae archaeon]